MDDDILDSHCDPKSPRAVTFEQITTADLLLAYGVKTTPCTNAENCLAYKMDLYFKKEFMQPTGSFKERGAKLALLLLSNKQKEIGVICASTGNHAVVCWSITWAVLNVLLLTIIKVHQPPKSFGARVLLFIVVRDNGGTYHFMQALSYHGNELNIPITVVMPTCTLVSNIEKCHSYNARVIVEGRDICESRVVALVLAKQHDLEYINGYDHPDVIAGCGTIGFEILKQIPKISAVVVPVGGGGLIAGLATTIKTVSPTTKIIGVEVEKCPSFKLALQKGAPIYTAPNNSLAESLLVPIVGYNALAMSANLIDKIVVVREVWVALAMLRLAEEEGCIVEGAGAVGLAAILSGQLRELEMKRVVVLLTGCNISVTAFGCALERGLAAERRFLQAECNGSKHERRVHELFEKLSPFGLSTQELLADCVWLKTVYKWEEEYTYMPYTSQVLSLAKLRSQAEENAQPVLKQETPQASSKGAIPKQKLHEREKEIDASTMKEEEPDDREQQPHTSQQRHEGAQEHEQGEIKFKKLPKTYYRRIVSRKHTI